MTNFSLSSPLKRRRRSFLTGILVLALVVLAVDVSLTIFIDRELKRFQRDIAEAGDFSFQYRSVFFNLFQGIAIRGLEVDKGDEILARARRLDLGFDLVSLVSARKALVKNIRMRKAHLYLDKTADLLAFLKYVLSRPSQPVGLFKTIHFRAGDLWIGDMMQLDFKGYFSSILGRSFSSRGRLHLKYLVLAPYASADVFKGSPFYKPFDYVFEAETSGDDLSVPRLQMSNGFLRVTGSGHIARYQTQAGLELDLKVFNIVLDDFPAFNAEHVQAQGVLDVGARFTGSLDAVKAFADIKVSSAQLVFFNALSLSRINGSVLFVGDHLTAQQLSLSINGVPFQADASVSGGAFPHLVLHLSSRAEPGGQNAFVLDLDGDLVENALRGDIKTQLRYASGATTNSLDFDLKGFRMGYEDDLYLKADFLGVGLFIKPPEGEARAKKIAKNIGLEDLFLIVRKKEDGFSLEYVRALCYNGTLEGVVHFLTLREALVANGELHVKGVDLDDFSSKTKNLSTVLLGKLAGDLKFDTSAPDLLKGQVFVTDGVVEQNALLDAVSDFLGVASLKKVAFDDLSIFFSGGKGNYASRVNLASERVKGSLEGKITSYDKMDGYLMVRLATDLLKESKQFKKLLAYIKHDQPQVVFPFKISSYIDSPRVLWLKNEFKEKLQNLLPESNKRFLQRQVNDMVEKIGVE